MEPYDSSVIECFIWDLQETWWRSTEETSISTTDTSICVSFETCLRFRGEVLIGGRCYVLLRHCHDVSIRRHGHVPLIHTRSTETSLDVSFETYLRRRGSYRKTSLRSRHDVLLLSGVIATEPKTVFLFT